MLKYYSWVAAEKTLSIVPFGEPLFQTASIIAHANGRSKRRLHGCATSYRLVRKAHELAPPGGTILDVGTGWHHHDAILLSLLDPNYKIYLFDVQDKSRAEYIKTYLQYLLGILDELEAEIGVDKRSARERISHLLTLNSREDIYRACNFELCITRKTDAPFLREGSIDFMISNCVLTHIPPRILEPELHTLRRMLKPEGAMYMLVGHEDHWAFHDPMMNRFNFFRFSDRMYSMIFETKFEYQNRMVRAEYLPIFDRAGFRIDDYYAYISDQSRSFIDQLSHIDERFAQHPREELAIIHSYFLLRPATQQAAVPSPG